MVLYSALKLIDFLICDQTDTFEDFISIVCAAFVRESRSNYSSAADSVNTVKGSERVVCGFLHCLEYTDECVAGLLRWLARLQEFVFGAEGAAG